MEIQGYREYYSKTLEDLFTEEFKFFTYNIALRNAKKRLRMYANLFSRDCRKTLLNNKSNCSKCLSENNLTIDHIYPISKGGKNELSNVQILCLTCNLQKSNKI